MYKSTYLEITSVASDITNKIPKESGYKIESSIGLSSEDFKRFSNPTISITQTTTKKYKVKS